MKKKPTSPMLEYEFTLKFALPGFDDAAEQHVKNLFDAGCDDALVGIGRSGHIILDFSRTAKSAEIAMTSAVTDVRRAIPTAVFKEACPDFVGATQISEIAGCSRQNIKKLIDADSQFPLPIHEVGSQVYHLSSVLPRLAAHFGSPINAELMSVASFAQELNLSKQVFSSSGRPLFARRNYCLQVRRALGIITLRACSSTVRAKDS
jgi:biotin operon repressor